MASNALSETSTMAEKDDVGAPLDARQLSRIHSEKEGGRAEAPDHRSLSPSCTRSNTKGAVPEDPNNAPLERIATADYPKAFTLVFIILALICSVFLVSLDMTIVATAIPRITDDFHSLDQVGWYGSAFFLTLASFQSTWGKAYKYFPLKTTFMISIAIFELGSLICAVAHNSTTLIVGRAVAGVGGAGIASGAYTIIAFAAPPQQRPAFTGILGATYGCASIIGPLLSGVFTDHISWRWCFYINLPIGVTSACIILLSFTTPAAAKPANATLLEKILQMDPLGTFTIMAAVVCYLLALQWGGVTKPWSDSSVIGTLVGFGLLIIVFIGIEWYMGERALLQGRLLKQRTILVTCVYVFFFSGSFFILLYYLPIYFQSISNVSAAESGIRNLPLVIGASLFTIVSGGLITMYGHFTPVLIVAAAVAIIGSSLVYTLNIGSSAGAWIGYQALAGIGLGLGIQVPVIANQGSVRVSDISSVSAVTLFFQTIGGSFFVSAGQTAFENKLVAVLPKTAPNVNPHMVVATGATELRKVFEAADIPGILEAYMQGLKVTFALCIALAGISTVIAFASEWRRLHGHGAGHGAAV
jgi:MFS transporter, DHA2 family, glioxin efflux transporter